MNSISKAVAGLTVVSPLAGGGVVNNWGKYMSIRTAVGDVESTKEPTKKVISDDGIYGYFLDEKGLTFKKLSWEEYAEYNGTGTGEKGQTWSTGWNRTPDCTKGKSNDKCIDISNVFWTYT